MFYCVSWPSKVKQKLKKKKEQARSTRIFKHEGKSGGGGWRGDTRVVLSKNRTVLTKTESPVSPTTHCYRHSSPPSASSFSMRSRLISPYWTSVKAVMTMTIFSDLLSFLRSLTWMRAFLFSSTSYSCPSFVVLSMVTRIKQKWWSCWRG